MLDWILIVTITTGSLAVTESAYREDLGYETVDRGEIEHSLAESWGADAVAGSPYIIMRPASGRDVYLRFIESDPIEGIVPHATEGWNAAEMLVEDTDELALQLADSKYFRVVGPPAFLTPEQTIRALQVIGPNNEMLYLTKIIQPEKVGLDIGTAESYVDQVFIVIAGGHDHMKLTHFYRDQFKLQVTEPEFYRIAVLSQAYGLPEDYEHPLSLAILENKFFLELDQYPAEAQTRPVRPAMLPTGIAMVTFEIKSLDEFSGPFLSRPISSSSMPYSGRRSATIRGAVGELIELVESPLGRNISGQDRSH